MKTLLAALAITVLLVGCKKDDDDPTPTPTPPLTSNDGLFYVRYEVLSAGGYYMDVVSTSGGIAEPRIDHIWATNDTVVYDTLLEQTHIALMASENVQHANARIWVNNAVQASTQGGAGAGATVEFQ